MMLIPILPLTWPFDFVALLVTIAVGASEHRVAMCSILTEHALIVGAVLKLIIFAGSRLK